MYNMPIISCEKKRKRQTVRILYCPIMTFLLSERVEHHQEKLGHATHAHACPEQNKTKQETRDEARINEEEDGTE